MNIYDINVKNSKGEEISLSKFKGKVLLIVNTATECTFTPQYEGLEYLYEKYNKKGLEILDFPCNQFDMQAPGTDDEIHAFCTIRYHTSFDQFKKIDVNGRTAEPLYEYLKNQKYFDERNREVRWNFEKFLVDRKGNVVDRYSSPTTPEMIERDIRRLL